MNNSKCIICKRNIGLLGFKCKCKNVYCVNHKYPEQHQCSFDFKETQKKRLEKELVQVLPEKVVKF